MSHHYSYEEDQDVERKPTFTYAYESETIESESIEHETTETVIDERGEVFSYVYPGAPCPDCHGKGAIALLVSKSKCPKCEGTGLVYKL